MLQVVASCDDAEILWFDLPYTERIVENEVYTCVFQ